MIRSISSSEKFYEQFAAQSAELMQNMSKLSEQQQSTYLTTSIGIPQCTEEMDTETVIKTISKLELENKALRVKLLGAEQEIEREKESNQIYLSKCNHYIKWIESLQNYANAEKNKKEQDINIIRLTIEKSAQLQLMNTEQKCKNLEDQLLQAKTELKICNEGAIRYKEQNDQLRGELQKISEMFNETRKELVASSNLHYVFLIFLLNYFRK